MLLRSFLKKSWIGLTFIKPFLYTEKIFPTFSFLLSIEISYTDCLCNVKQILDSWTTTNFVLINYPGFLVDLFLGLHHFATNLFRIFYLMFILQTFDSDGWQWQVIFHFQMSFLGLVILLCWPQNKLSVSYCTILWKRFCKTGAAFFVKSSLWCASESILAKSFLFEKILNYRFKFFKSYGTISSCAHFSKLYF